VSVSLPMIELLKNIWKNDLAAVDEVNVGVLTSRMILLYSIFDVALPSLTVGKIRSISNVSGS
jgi:hypothetical protein